MALQVDCAHRARLTTRVGSCRRAITITTTRADFGGRRCGSLMRIFGAVRRVHGVRCSQHSPTRALDERTTDERPSAINRNWGGGPQAQVGERRAACPTRSPADHAAAATAATTSQYHHHKDTTTAVGRHATAATAATATATATATDVATRHHRRHRRSTRARELEDAGGGKLRGGLPGRSRRPPHLARCLRSTRSTDRVLVSPRFGTHSAAGPRGRRGLSCPAPRAIARAVAPQVLRVRITSQSRPAQHRSRALPHVLRREEHVSCAWSTFRRSGNFRASCNTTHQLTRRTALAAYRNSRPLPRPTHADVRPVRWSRTGRRWRPRTPPRKRVLLSMSCSRLVRRSLGTLAT